MTFGRALHGDKLTPQQQRARQQEIAKRALLIDKVARRSSAPGDEALLAYQEGNKAIGLPPLRGKTDSGDYGFGGGKLVVLSGVAGSTLSADDKYDMEMSVATKPGVAADAFYAPHASRVKVALLDPEAIRTWKGYVKKMAAMRKVRCATPLVCVVVGPTTPQGQPACLPAGACRSGKGRTRDRRACWPTVAAAAHPPPRTHRPRTHRPRVPDLVLPLLLAGWSAVAPQLLHGDGGFEFGTIEVKQILEGGLETGGYTVLCIPGGTAKEFMKELGDAGKAAIQKFVRAGGGFVGICAGAYCGTNWGLGLLDVDLPWIKQWARGWHPTCPVMFTPAAATTLGPDHAGSTTCRYNNGPLMRPGKGVDVLANFGDIELRGSRGKYTPVMRNCPCIVSGKFGDGRVVLVSPHPEDGMAPVLRQLIRLASGLLDDYNDGTLELGRKAGEMAAELVGMCQDDAAAAAMDEVAAAAMDEVAAAAMDEVAAAAAAGCDGQAPGAGSSEGAPTPATTPSPPPTPGVEPGAVDLGEGAAGEGADAGAGAAGAADAADAAEAPPLMAGGAGKAKAAGRPGPAPRRAATGGPAPAVQLSKAQLARLEVLKQERAPSPPVPPAPTRLASVAAVLRLATKKATPAAAAPPPGKPGLRRAPSKARLARLATSKRTQPKVKRHAPSVSSPTSGVKAVVAPTWSPSFDFGGGGGGGGGGDSGSDGGAMVVTSQATAAPPGGAGRGVGHAIEGGAANSTAEAPAAPDPTATTTVATSATATKSTPTRAPRAALRPTPPRAPRQTPAGTGPKHPAASFRFRLTKAVVTVGCEADPGSNAPGAAFAIGRGPKPVAQTTAVPTRDERQGVGAGAGAGSIADARLQTRSTQHSNRRSSRPLPR